MLNHVEVALQKMADGYNCAQSVLFAYSQELGLDPDLALKLATGFGAGMARRGEVCGAVTGAILAVGAKYGRGKNDDKPVTEATYAKIQELMDNFQAVQGTVLCRQLLNGCDLTTEEGRQYFRDNDLSSRVCRPCVQTAAQILQGILIPKNL